MQFDMFVSSTWKTYHSPKSPLSFLKVKEHAFSLHFVANLKIDKVFLPLKEFDKPKDASFQCCNLECMLSYSPSCAP